MKIICVMGARPNFVKVAALYRAFTKYPEFSVKLLHTGQHHDDAMYRVFLKQLELPDPDFSLDVHGGSHTEQTAYIMLGFEKVLLSERPDMVVVVGDVNSSLACALVAAKEAIRVIHVEAGLRSGDKRMPEEVNRILIDHISDELFVSERSAITNLHSENIEPGKIHFVGNVMIDSLVFSRKRAEELSVFKRFGLQSKAYFVMTMHRPSNVDSTDQLTGLMALVKAACELRPLIFPVHPRTKANLERYGIWDDLGKMNGLILLPPQGYLEFINLVANSMLVITDSGGVQEETTFLGVPCITLRENTERPVTIDGGTNYLAGCSQMDAAIAVVKKILNGKQKQSSLPELWDGFASDRIAQLVKEKYIK
ncbi:UDP-N-acetylglucosamine 2-epimerase (non-hydrolyzing) [Dyadobacter sp. CY261]|uniref:non-hydrolyzing UDP-N-acetylglucosamine 2-epimerase n=1 Tax=Dyadobacter sp. CY261 TaxID=2907203 RepID=UPI001F36DB4C|nr:UDP-N-acetylglucosamine 2-epimerase (non-hydrolyzing) [Dyadobacter sp. CY261]MCF0073418.1 UDP-N-acetylglucosamine 2-epimerase (non-hydrolyzing) [Dyadobacter sp. CY261]